MIYLLTNYITNIYSDRDTPGTRDAKKIATNSMIYACTHVALRIQVAKKQARSRRGHGVMSDQTPAVARLTCSGSGPALMWLLRGPGGRRCARPTCSPSCAHGHICVTIGGLVGNCDAL